MDEANDSAECEPCIPSIAETGQALVCVDPAEIAHLRAQVTAVRALCEDHRAESVTGGRTDIDSLWPSEVLAALDAASG